MNAHPIIAHALPTQGTYRTTVGYVCMPSPQECAESCQIICGKRVDPSLVISSVDNLLTCILPSIPSHFFAVHDTPSGNNVTSVGKIAMDLLEDISDR